MPPRRRRTTETAEQQPIQQGIRIEGPIRWEGTEEVPVLYADQMFVQFSQGAFILTFGLTGLPYERLTQEVGQRIQQEGLNVRTIARIAVTASRIGTFVQVLDNFVQRTQLGESQPPSLPSREEIVP